MSEVTDLQKFTIRNVDCYVFGRYAGVARREKDFPQHKRGTSPCTARYTARSTMHRHRRLSLLGYVHLHLESSLSPRFFNIKPTIS